MLLAETLISDTQKGPSRLKDYADQCGLDERVCRQANQQWYLDGIRHIEATALSVPDVQPSVAAAVVKQITQLLIVDLQQLHLNLILTLQQQAFDCLLQGFLPEWQVLVNRYCFCMEQTLSTCLHHNRHYFGHHV